MTEFQSFNAAVLVIGNEILSGRTQDANLPYICQKLNKIGVYVREARVIPDVEEIIIEHVLSLHKKYDYVFTTGGIGPTHDDITAASIAKAFGREVEFNEGAIKILTARYGSHELTPGRKNMARMPVGATLLQNPVSAAPGFQIENVYVMAGFPEIMRGMLDCLIKDLQEGEPVQSITLRCKLLEGDLAAGLEEIQNEFSNIDVGSYPFLKIGEFGVRVVLRSQDATGLQKAADKVAALMRTLGDEPILESEESF